MSIFEAAADEAREQTTDQSADEDANGQSVGAASESITGRGAETTVAGESVSIEEPETTQSDEDNWLTGTSHYGVPRGRDAIEAREIVQTSAMQSIVNAIADQIVGGDLSFETDGDDLSGSAGDLRDVLHDVLRGPHLMDDDLDDLIVAAIEDMMGPGNAYWQLLPSEDGSLPVASLIPLDPLTIRHNVNRHGYPQDPPYYQAQGAFAGGGVGTLNNIDPTPLQDGDLAVMRYPRGRRSHRFYPYSPALQVREWLEILTNSTTHHNRYYADNEIPPGLLQVMQANGNDLDTIKDKLQAASGDPRSVEVIGGEGAAQWIEMGGTAVNLDIIQEQQWFFQMCLGSLGLGQHELGFTEDANTSNGEVEAARIYKRIGKSFESQFAGAFRHIASQFEAYEALGRPFEIRLRYTDPNEERAREERLREMWNDGALTLRQYIRRRGDEDLADNPMEVEVGDQVVDYGDYPKFVVEHLLRAARSTVPEDQAEDVADQLPTE